MEVRFHGVRGSAPAPGAAFAQFGGDTVCVEVASQAGRLFIDAGSGLRHASPEFEPGEELDLILSHYHFDHLIGLPFFSPLWMRAARLRVWAPRFAGVDPRPIIARFFSPPYCPIALDETPCRVELRAFTPGDGWRLGPGMRVETALLNHPGGCAAVRVEGAPGESAVYASDVEIDGGAADDRLVDFARRTCLFICDAMWTADEGAARRGWGHSAWTEAVAVGSASGATQTALFHHDPQRTDAALAAMDVAAAATHKGARFARQGDVVTLGAQPADALRRGN